MAQGILDGRFRIKGHQVTMSPGHQLKERYRGSWRKHWRGFFARR